MSFLMCLEEGIASSLFLLSCCMGDRHYLVLRNLAGSQEVVTWVWVVSSVGFVFAIASAPSDFLYLNNEYLIYKKSK